LGELSRRGNARGKEAVKAQDKVFETGEKVAKKAFQVFRDRLHLNPLLPKWDVKIKPLR